MFETLPDFLQKHPRVRLIIVDSISFHFRQGFVDMGHRMRVLNRVAQDLMALAESTHTAVRPHPDLPECILCHLSIALRSSSRIKSRSASMRIMNRRPSPFWVLRRCIGGHGVIRGVFLGNSWGQCTNAQVRLYWNASTRYAGIYKAPNMERRAVPFQITKNGIRNLS